MSQLRVAVSFPDRPPLEEQTEILNQLMRALKDTMGLNQRLSRLPELQLPGAQRPAGGAPASAASGSSDDVPLRVFVLDFPDGDSCTAALRALGGWYMRHPTQSISLKADGPGGGVNLRLKSFSTVAFAQAVSRINELMAAEAS